MLQAVVHPVNVDGVTQNFLQVRLRNLDVVEELPEEDSGGTRNDSTCHGVRVHKGWMREARLLWLKARRPTAVSGFPL